MSVAPTPESNSALLPRLLNRSISAARILLLCLAMLLIPAGLYYYLVIHDQMTYRDQRAFRSLDEVQLQLNQAIEVAKAFSLYAPTSEFQASIVEFAARHKLVLHAEERVSRPEIVAAIIAESLNNHAPEVLWKYLSNANDKDSFPTVFARDYLTKIKARHIVDVVQDHTTKNLTVPKNWKLLKRDWLAAGKDEPAAAYFARLAKLAKCDKPDEKNYADDGEKMLADFVCQQNANPEYQLFDTERDAIKVIYERAVVVCTDDKLNKEKNIEACALNNLRAWMPKGSGTAEELALRMHAGLSLTKESPPFSLRENVPECQKNNGTSLAFWNEQADQDASVRIYRCGARSPQIPVEIALKSFLGQGNWFDALDAVYLVREDGKVLLNLQKPVTAKSDGKLYPSATALPRLLNLKSILDEKSASADSDKSNPKILPAGPKMRDLEIASQAVRVYTQQIQLPVRFCAVRDEKCADEKLFLVGAREQHLMAATQMLQPGTFLLWLCVLLIALFAWPWLQLFFSQQLLAVPPRSVRALVVSSILLALPVVLGFWAYFSYQSAVNVMERSAEKTASSILKTWDAELKQSVAKLIEEQSKWSLTTLARLEGADENFQLRLSQSHLEILQNDQEKYECYILARQAGQDARARNCVKQAEVNPQAKPQRLPVMHSVFEFDEKGRIDKTILQHSELLPAYSAEATAEGRGYLQALLTQQTWPWQGEKKIHDWTIDGFVIERLHNRADAQLISQIALAVHSEQDPSKKESKFISGNFPAYSFEFMPAPPGFEYAVIDNQTGVALYHSAPGRVLAENLYKESQHDNRLLAAVEFGSQDSFRGHYHGQSVLFHVQPLRSVPWTLVLIGELAPLQLGLVNISLLTLGFCLSPLLVLLACYLTARLCGKRASWAWPQWRLRERYRPLSIMLILHGISQYLVLAELAYLSFLIATALLVVSTLALNLAVLSHGGAFRVPSPAARLLSVSWKLMRPAAAQTPANLSPWQPLAFTLLLLCLLAQLLLLFFSPDALWRQTDNGWSGHLPFLLLAAVLMSVLILRLRRHLLLLATKTPFESRLAAGTESGQVYHSVPHFYRDYRNWAVLVIAILVWVPASVILRNSCEQIGQRLQHVAAMALAENWQNHQKKLQEFGQIHFPTRFKANENFALPETVEKGLHEVFPIESQLLKFQFASAQPLRSERCERRINPASTFTQLALELAGKLTPDQAILFAAGRAMSEKNPARFEIGKFEGRDDAYCVIDTAAGSGTDAAVRQFAVSMPSISQLPNWPLRLILLAVATGITYVAVRGLMRTVLAGKFVAHFPPPAALVLSNKFASLSDLRKQQLLQRELAVLPSSLRQQIETSLDANSSLHETVLAIGASASTWYANRWVKLSETQQQLLYLIARGNFPLPTHSPAVEHLLRQGWLRHGPQLQVASESLRRYVLQAAPETQQRLWEAPPADDLWQTLRYPLGVAIVLLLAWVALAGGEMAKLLAGALASATGLVTTFRQAQQKFKGGN